MAIVELGQDIPVDVGIIAVPCDCVDVLVRFAQDVLRV